MIGFQLVYKLIVERWPLTRLNEVWFSVTSWRLQGGN